MPRLPDSLVGMLGDSGEAVTRCYIVESIVEPIRVVRREPGADQDSLSPMIQVGPLTPEQIADVTAFVLQGVVSGSFASPKIPGTRGR